MTAPTPSHAEPALPPPGRRLPVPFQALLLAGFAGLALLGFVALPAAFGQGPGAAPDDSNAAFSPTAQQWAGMKIMRVTSRLIQPTTEAEGRVALSDNSSTAIFSPLSGRVTRVFAELGDTLPAGAPLFAVASPEVAQGENDLVSALANLRTARVQLELATANEARQHALFQARGAALKDWQQSRVDLATAQGGLASSSVAVAAVRGRLVSLGLSPADITAIETAPDPARLSADVPVRTPVAGVVTQRQITLGQNLVGTVASNGGAAAVFTVGDLRHLWLIAYAAEDQAGRLHVGDVVRVRVPDLGARIVTARLSAVSPVVDPATHRVPVRADIDNADLALRPDMLARFDIATGPAAPGIAIPEAAVIYEGAEAHVWVADPARHTLALRAIRPGAVTGGQLAVLDGLKDGDSIVTSGAVFIDRALSGD